MFLFFRKQEIQQKVVGMTLEDSIFETRAQPSSQLEKRKKKTPSKESLLNNHNIKQERL